MMIVAEKFKKVSILRPAGAKRAPRDQLASNLISTHNIRTKTRNHKANKTGIHQRL